MPIPRHGPVDVSSAVCRPQRLWAWSCLAIAMAVCLLATWHFRQVFYPGRLSFDSVHQYHQAVIGEFDDQHPPIMSIALHVVLRCGGDIQHVMLLQCAAGVFGVFFLAYESLRYGLGRRLGAPQAALAATAVFLLLSTPWSPLPIYLMTFWKDVWVLIGFCWIAALSLNIFRTRSARPDAALAVKLAGYVLLVTFTLLSRHNALVVAPVFCLLLALFLKPALPARGVWASALALGLLPLGTYWGASVAMYRLFPIRCMSFGSLVLGFELTSLCALYPEAVEELPHTKAFLLPDYRDKYVRGFWMFGMYRGGYIEDTQHLKSDYRLALQKFPLQMLRVKAINFWEHLRGNPWLKYQADIFPGPMCGVVYTFPTNPAYESRRCWATAKMESLFRSRLRQWVFARHLPWMLLTGVAVGLLAGVAWWNRHAALGRAALIAAIPAAYYASYFCASVGGDFRYMYPATLLAQVSITALACGAGLLAAGRLRSSSLRGAGSQDQNAALLPAAADHRKAA